MTTVPLKSLSHWLALLEQRHPSAIELGLERVGVVADRLFLREFGCPVITVAGTNGKGSTVATIVAIARAAGWQVGSYTSPHLLHFNERIRGNGECINDTELVLALEAIEASRGEVSLTYFEHTTLAALWWFQRQNLDLLVLEVGLGGRLDAVNLVDASVAVITNIGLDHTDWLGDDLASIAREKAGIMRHGRPVVLGERSPEPILLAQAQALQAPVSMKGRDYDFSVRAEQGAWQFGEWLLPLPGVALDNAATAIAALQALARPLTVADIAEGLRHVQVAGRMQRLPWPPALMSAAAMPELIVDVAHNPHGATFLWQHIAPTKGRTIAVLAMLADKDSAGVISASADSVDSWCLASLRGARGQSAAALAAVAQACAISAYSEHADVIDALRYARLQATERDRIVVFGSFFTVAAVLALCE